MEKDIIENNNIVIRNGRPSDHDRIFSIMKDWWGGRDLTNLLLKNFFIDFNNTIFIAEEKDVLIGFLVGYFSQVHRKEAYIHLIGVHPHKRYMGIARLLYEKFFETCRSHDRTIIRACTSPVNENSIKYHQRVGFRIEPGNDEVNGVPITADYLGRGNHMVLFTKELK